jgi:hypothetical protein
MQDDLSEREIAASLLDSMLHGSSATMSTDRAKKLTDIALIAASQIVCATPVDVPGNRREWPSE